MQNENCLFVKHSSASITIIALYVDDLIIAGKSAEVNQTKDFLKSRYTMKDLGFVNHILGCEVFQDPSSKTLYLTQRRYILATLKRFLNKTELKKIGLNTSPMEASVALMLQHSSCIGHLWYFTRFLFNLSLLGTLAPTLFLLQFCFTDQRTVR